MSVASRISKLKEQRDDMLENSELFPGTTLAESLRMVDEELSLLAGMNVAGQNAGEGVLYWNNQDESGWRWYWSPWERPEDFILCRDAGENEKAPRNISVITVPFSRMGVEVRDNGAVILHLLATSDTQGNVTDHQ